MPSTTLTSSSQQPTHSIKKNKTTTKQVFQSISRTLSPAKPTSSTSSHTKSSNLPPTPPQSPEKINRSNHEDHEEEVVVEDFVDVNLSENEKRTINQTEVIKQSEQVQIGIYLSNLSSTPLDQTNNEIVEETQQETHHGLLKDTNEWKEFFKTRKDDVERERKLPNQPQSIDNLTTVTNTITTTTGVSNSDLCNTSIDQVSLKQTNGSKTQLSLDPTDTTQTTTIPENEVTQTKRDQSKTTPVNGSVINHLSLEFSSPTISLPTFSSPKIISLPTLEPSPSSPTNTEPPLPSSASSIASSSATTTKPSLTPMTPAEVISEEIINNEILTTPSPIQTRISKSKIGLKDFECIRVLGKGCAGKVLMVKYKSNINHKQNQSVYAMKSIRKNHVLAHRELQHTLTEQSVLKRVANEPGSNPFIVRLWWSFHDKDHLFLVMDFHPGGDLATQLARWGRLGRDRARFYAAEITEGVTSLHKSGVIYRDLKPENILIAFDGHIVLTDFGLSKQFKPNDEVEERTMTFCGTAEYLAPEVLLGEPYSYEVDWWSFGTMLFEMLTGLTPFWSEDHATMYRRVLHDELTFNEDSSRVMDHDTKTLLRGLLQRNPAVRMTGTRIKKHPYFGMIDWDHVRHKRYIPPYVPAVNPNDATDTQNFDETFLAMEPTHVQDEDPTSVGVGDKQ
ncbi:hypothetical protein CROQUDRAFT_249694 [Cronartium quercuum f. sp. fusiforme G11]|uniref:Uncharacterized protein n=1 Tax=Cronartium quercuum f. sp. fusiforme G11 TaxID=708437 RepID=A0A9P6NEH2_9BASI|nr:hypothetical protein CROQUDRAFT_249694 [Cronartium quercuum f. sp. fusiforme G11]